MEEVETEYRKLTIDEANELVIQHKGWSESIARSVARSWNLDWKLDGLDGAALEALIFCARRFQPDRGIPFKGYARKRIHEASTDAARKCTGWQKAEESASRTERLAKQVSAELFNVFPELRSGQLIIEEGEEGGEGGTRVALQQLLIGASIIATRHGLESATPEEAVDYKRMLLAIGGLDPVHQLLIWKVYWEGSSLRTVATEWETDELNVIREHKVLVEFLQKSFARGKQVSIPRVRPGLRHVSARIRKKDNIGMFQQLLSED